MSDHFYPLNQPSSPEGMGARDQPKPPEPEFDDESAAAKKLAVVSQHEYLAIPQHGFKKPIWELERLIGQYARQRATLAEDLARSDVASDLCSLRTRALRAETRANEAETALRQYVAENETGEDLLLSHESRIERLGDELAEANREIGELRSRVGKPVTCEEARTILGTHGSGGLISDIDLGRAARALLAADYAILPVSMERELLAARKRLSALDEFIETLRV